MLLTAISDLLSASIPAVTAGNDVHAPGAAWCVTELSFQAFF
jgi:hypothetical protein